MGITLVTCQEPSKSAVGFEMKLLDPAELMCSGCRLLSFAVLLVVGYSRPALCPCKKKAKTNPALESCARAHVFWLVRFAGCCRFAVLLVVTRICPLQDEAKTNLVFWEKPNQGSVKHSQFCHGFPFDLQSKVFTRTLNR